MVKSKELVKTGKKGALAELAERLSIDEKQLENTLMNTVIKKATPQEFTAFVIVANTYKLNPLLQEIYAFPNRGGITPIVPIDGWISLINRQKDLDGIELIENREDGKVVSVTCKIFHKGRSHATIVTEYMCECKRNTEPWNKWSIRMLRHKALIQCARIAYGFSGIYDPDEGERIAETIEVTPVEENLEPRAIESPQSSEDKPETTETPKDTKTTPKEEKPLEEISDEKFADDLSKELLGISLPDKPIIMANGEKAEGVEQTKKTLTANFKAMRESIGNDKYYQILETFGVKGLSEVKIMKKMYNIWDMMQLEVS